MRRDLAPCGNCHSHCPENPSQRIESNFERVCLHAARSTCAQIVSTCRTAGSHSILYFSSHDFSRHLIPYPTRRLGSSVSALCRIKTNLLEVVLSLLRTISRTLRMTAISMWREAMAYTLLLCKRSTFSIFENFEVTFDVFIDDDARCLSFVSCQGNIHRLGFCRNLKLDQGMTGSF